MVTAMRIVCTLMLFLAGVQLGIGEVKAIEIINAALWLVLSLYWFVKVDTPWRP